MRARGLGGFWAFGSGAPEEPGVFFFVALAPLRPLWGRQWTTYGVVGWSACLEPGRPRTRRELCYCDYLRVLGRQAHGGPNWSSLAIIVRECLVPLDI